MLGAADRAEADRRLGPLLGRLGVKAADTAARRVAAELDAAAVVARMEAAVRSRRVTMRAAVDGMAYLTVLGPMVEVAGAHAALTARARSVVAGHCDDEPHGGRSVGAVAADTALAAMSGRSPGGVQPVEVHLVMTDRALLGTGDGTRSVMEPARVPGHGSLPAPAARWWLREADEGSVWLRRLYTSPDGRDLAAMDSRRRTFTGMLRRMLVLRDDVCTTPWCGAAIAHADHATPSREGGATDFVTGNGKCVRCNHVKEAPGWTTTATSAASDDEARSRPSGAPRCPAAAAARGDCRARPRDPDAERPSPRLRPAAPPRLGKRPRALGCAARRACGPRGPGPDATNFAHGDPAIADRGSALKDPATAIANRAAATSADPAQGSKRPVHGSAGAAHQPSRAGALPLPDVTTPGRDGADRRATRVSGMPSTPSLDLTLDATALTAALCDIESVSLDEATLAEAVEQALAALPHLELTRIGNTVVARTSLGRARAGGPRRPHRHRAADRRPAEPAHPARRRTRGEVLWGRGTVDMKGGVAVMLRVAHEVREPSRDVTFVFYEGEEIDSQFNGLLHVEQQRRDLIDDADFAVLLEPTDGRVEGGCKGTLRAEVTTKGIASHSARPWKGHNAIHDAADVLARLVAYEPATREVDGLEFREALNAVLIGGGIAGNVIPDRCVVTVNYRYAPDLSEADAEAHVRQVFSGFDVEVLDNAAGARPGLTSRRPGPSSRRSACRSRPSRAGPTSRASRRWGSRPSTSAPATRTSRTWTTSSARSSSTARARRPSCAGSPDAASPTRVTRAGASTRRGIAWRRGPDPRPESPSGAARPGRRPTSTTRAPVVMRRVAGAGLDHRPAPARQPRLGRLGAHRPVARHAHPVRVRHRLRRARRARARRSASSARRAPARRPDLRARHRRRAAPGRGRLRRHHRRRARRDGGRQPRRPRGRRHVASASASSCPSRPGSTSTSTSGSTSATSSRARRCSSSTRRASSSCPAASARSTSCSRP